MVFYLVSFFTVPQCFYSSSPLSPFVHGSRRDFHFWTARRGVTSPFGHFGHPRAQNDGRRRVFTALVLLPPVVLLPRWFSLPPVVFYRPCPALPGLASPHRPCPALAGPVQRFMGCPGLTAPHGLGISLCVIVPFAVHQCSGGLYAFHGFPCFLNFVGSHGFRMLARDYVGLSKGVEQLSPTLMTLVALHAPRALVSALRRLPTYQTVYRPRAPAPARKT